MRMSTLFGLTLREAPSGVEVASYGLLLRARYIRQLAAGIFSYLPLAKRSIGKIKNILREEMDAAGGQEVSMPVVQPADAWERSGRYSTTGQELVRLSDRRNRGMVLAMTHEESSPALPRVKWTLTRNCRGSFTRSRPSSATIRVPGLA